MVYGDAIEKEATRLEKALRGDKHFAPGLERVEYTSETRNKHTVEISRAHDRNKQQGECHPDYVVKHIDYEFRNSYTLYRTAADGSNYTTPITGDWIKVMGESLVDIEEHCEPGIKDLPTLPENYCSVFKGEELIYEGKLSDLRIEMSLGIEATEIIEKGDSVA